MRILIVAAGSRGDVAPCTGLAARLRSAGHRVAIAAHRPFADLVTATGSEFRPLPGDPRTVLAAAALDPRAARPALRYLADLADGLAEATRPGVDLLLTGVVAAPAARALGIPVLATYLQPAHPTRDFAPPLTRLHSLGAPGNRLAWALQRWVLNAPDDLPTLYGYSPAVLARPADWRPEVQVVGYWWPQTPAGWRPPTGLAEFLADGPPPIYVGLGSLADGEAARRFTANAVAAARRLGLRVVLGGGGDPAPGVHPIADVPHEHLFPQVAAVVHHGGAGTTAAALRAGVPQVPVPVQADQHLWAHRSVALGVAPAALRLYHPTTVADALGAAVRDPAYRDRAQKLAGQVEAEDGAAAVIEAIERL
ncbi:glycosyltransferase [Cryptosporangium phraense]|uniref:Glycosyltransferase family 1 protein n=1 Tax=Cryptosporangium phraense TaxID=2593070 RepID=A0A545AVT5_9ACTN|nr:glycosyltransferase [Cryptosporangium phraense]TQS45447.1 glycosyltransferase family 1 protein [Cryptosporangium phraense]